jgi:hypothetical protein
MRLLLINPRFPESFWSFKWAVDKMLSGKRAMNPPLGLAAGCFVPWKVRSWTSVIMPQRAGRIGIAAWASGHRQKDFASPVKGYVVAGGSVAVPRF